MGVPVESNTRRQWPKWLVWLVAIVAVIVATAAVAVVLYVKSASDNSNFLVNYVNSTGNGSNASQNKQLQQFLGQLHQGRVADCRQEVQGTTDLLRAAGVNPPPQGVAVAKGECNGTQ